MTHRHLMIGLPVAAAAIAVPSSAHAAQVQDVANSMASFAQAKAGSDAAERAAEKQARYLARKEAGKIADCNDCTDCAPCEACKECDEDARPNEGKEGARHA